MESIFEQLQLFFFFPQFAEFNLKYSKIVAPANGVILRKRAEANEMANPGKPIFDFGSKDKAMVIRVNLTDKDIIHVNLGDKAKVGFDAYGEVAFAGIIREIASIADPYTNTYEVEIEVDPKGKKLLSGFIGTVEIEAPAKTALIEIPVDALIKANKRFDMLILPGKRHGFGDYQTYFRHVMWEYFAEHLLGDYQQGADIRYKN